MARCVIYRRRPAVVRSGYAIVNYHDERVLNALNEDDRAPKENERAGSTKSGAAA